MLTGTVPWVGEVQEHERRQLTLGGHGAEELGSPGDRLGTWCMTQGRFAWWVDVPDGFFEPFSLLAAVGRE